MNWKELPKVELHLHLDCNLSYPLVSRLDPTITLEEYADKFIAPAKCSSLADYLTRILPANDLMQTAEQLHYRLTGKLRVTGDNLMSTTLPFESEGQVTLKDLPTDAN